MKQIGAAIVVLLVGAILKWPGWLIFLLMAGAVVLAGDTPRGLVPT